MIEQVKQAIHNASDNNQKVAMLHLQVFKHADELTGFDPKGFCKEIAISESYGAEFSKMIALARLMKEVGIKRT